MIPQIDVFIRCRDEFGLWGHYALKQTRDTYKPPPHPSKFELPCDKIILHMNPKMKGEEIVAPTHGHKSKRQL
jgi:hypothetical protein